jgi:predicted O-linked N-acetylglucosamine transferase (SPINDLY family)
MSKHFLFSTGILIIVFFSSINPGFAQDTTKKTSVVKPAAQKPAAIKPSTVKPVTVKPVVPANPSAYRYTQPKAAAADSALEKDKSLNGQYKYLISKLYHYQEPLASALWKNMRDTLNTERRKLAEAQSKLAIQTKDINTLKTDVTTKDQTLSESNAKRDEISLLGISLTKSSYNLLMWGLVIAFGAIAAVVIARSGAHTREARYRIKLYEELDEEYKTYKSKANEKEKKLARELQTERNKLDELLGRG